MRGSVLGLPLAVLGLMVSGPAFAQASASGALAPGTKAHRAPSAPVVAFREPPRLVMVPGTTVYVVQDGVRMDHDLFRYGVYWYAYDDGFWFRARSYRGPFRMIEVKYVPRAVISVPAKHWRRHPESPPELAKRPGGHGARLVAKGKRARGRRQD
jgi:hypothetical protein